MSGIEQLKQSIREYENAITSLDLLLDGMRVKLGLLINKVNEAIRAEAQEEAARSQADNKGENN